MWFSKSALGYRNGLRVRVFGREASAEWVQTNPEELVLNNASGRREILDRGGNVYVAGDKRYERFKVGHPAGFIEAFANLYVDMADSLEVFNKSKTFESNYVFGCEAALGGAQLLEAIAESALNEKWCTVRDQRKLND